MRVFFFLCTADRLPRIPQIYAQAAVGRIQNWVFIYKTARAKTVTDASKNICLQNYVQCHFFCRCVCLPLFWRKNRVFISSQGLCYLACMTRSVQPAGQTHYETPRGKLYGEDKSCFVPTNRFGARCIDSDETRDIVQLPAFESDIESPPPSRRPSRAPATSCG